MIWVLLYVWRLVPRYCCMCGKAQAMQPCKHCNGTGTEPAEVGFQAVRKPRKLCSYCVGTKTYPATVCKGHAQDPVFFGVNHRTGEPRV
jgi:hypothetical protein